MRYHVTLQSRYIGYVDATLDELKAAIRKGAKHPANVRFWLNEIGNHLHANI